MTYNPTNPNGQATSANSSPVVVASDQSAIDTNQSKIAGTTTDTNSGLKSAGTQRVVLATDQPQLTNALKVDGSAVTQPISASSLPLPTSAATSTKQSDGSQKTQIVDGAGNVVGATSNALDVNIKSNAVGGGGTSSNFGSAVPSAGTAAGFSDGTNMRAARTYDSDSGVGTENTLGVVLRKSASGGSVEAATSADPLRVDPTGTTTQPVSGTVTANAGTNLNTSALALETGGNLASVATNTTGLNSTVGTAGLAIPAKGVVVQGSDGTNARAIKTDTSGNVNVNVQGTLTVDTELPAAAALADSTANPTVPTAGSANMLWDNNGSAWNRQRSVFHGQNATGTGIAATGVLAEFDDVSPSAATENQFAPLRMSSNRNLYGTIRDAAGNERGVNVTSGNALVVDGSASTQPVSGTVAATQSGTWTVQPGNTANTTAWNMNLAPSTTGGWSVSSQTNLTTTATVSSAAGKFAGYMFMNLNSTPAYIQVFDTTGAVTLGTTTPTFVVPIPANSTAANGAGANLELTNGIAITNGIKVAATTTATGATTVTTGLTGFVLYK